MDDALDRKSQRVLANMASQEWKMLKAVEQFKLHDKG